MVCGNGLVRSDGSARTCMLATMHQTEPRIAAACTTTGDGHDPDKYRAIEDLNIVQLGGVRRWHTM